MIAVDERRPNGNHLRLREVGSVRLTALELRRFRAIATREDRSMASLLRRVIRLYLAGDLE